MCDVVVMLWWMMCVCGGGDDVGCVFVLVCDGDDK